MFLVDHLHQQRHRRDPRLGAVALPRPTSTASRYFDGTHLYEHADPRQGFHPDWGSCIFNYGRNEVRSFLLSQRPASGSTATTSTGCAWTPSPRCSTSTTRARRASGSPTSYGGRENLEAIDFLRRLNDGRLRELPRTCRRSPRSRRPGRWSRGPTYLGGLGFGLKWDMGWMHDTLAVHVATTRSTASTTTTELTFRMLYAFTENFVLPLSHDEVVHGKGSLLAKMPGDDWQQFANLRLLYAYMCAQPGKKLLFMGGEFGQWREWNHDASLDWHLLDGPRARGRPPAGRGPEPRSTGTRARAARARRRRRRLRVDRLRRLRPRAWSASFLRQGPDEPPWFCRRELHARRRDRLPRRRAPTAAAGASCSTPTRSSTAAAASRQLRRASRPSPSLARPPHSVAAHAASARRASGSAPLR